MAILSKLLYHSKNLFIVVLFFVHKPVLAQPIELIPGVEITAQYGYQYGSNAHPEIVQFQFAGCAGSATLSVSGYDIDNNSEVKVLVGDTTLGYLSKGRGNRRLNRGDSFAITVSAENTYVIGFQQTRIRETWGVTNILLDGCSPTGPDVEPEEPTDPEEPTEPEEPTGPDPEYVLLSSTLNTQRYGHNFGSSENYEEAVFSFENTGVKQTLSVVGYDINRSNEIEVLLNGSRIGYLSTGRKRKLNNGDVFDIPADSQIPGLNTVTFRQTRLGNAWGVTNLKLVPDSEPPPPVDENDPVYLQFNVANNGQYGNQFGASADVDFASFSFNKYAADIYISVHGFDIDTKKEVQVELNDVVIGHLSKGDNLSDNGGDVFLLPEDDQVNGTANSGTPTIIDPDTGTIIFANFFNSGAIVDGTDRYVSVCVSAPDDQGDRFAHFTTDVGRDDNIQIKAYPEFIIGTKFGLVGETSFRPFPQLTSDENFVYPALDAVSALVGLPAFTNNLPDIDLVVDIDEQNVVGSIRDVMIESWFYDTNANEALVGHHQNDYSDWTPYTQLPAIDPLNVPDYKAGDAIAGTLNNIVGAGHTNSNLRNVLLEMMVHIGPLSPNDVSYDPNNTNPFRNPSKHRLTDTPVTIGDYQYHIWHGSTYLSPVVVFSRETNILGESLLNLTEEGEINLDWNHFLDYTMGPLESMLAADGVSWALEDNIFPRMRAATGAIGGIEFGVEPQTNGVNDEPYRATVRKFEVIVRGKNFGL